MKKEQLEQLFKDLQGNFDTEEPRTGHELRFAEKLTPRTDGVVPLRPQKRHFWKPFAIAASIAVLFMLGLIRYLPTLTVSEQVARISPEISNTEIYFVSLIEEQVQELEQESSPETKQLIDDTLAQLTKLEGNYKKLEQDLLKGGNSKLILSAMITNFQTRIDLLTEVMNKIESIKTLKTYNDENYTI